MGSGLVVYFRGLNGCGTLLGGVSDPGFREFGVRWKRGSPLPPLEIKGLSPYELRKAAHILLRHTTGGE